MDPYSKCRRVTSYRASEIIYLANENDPGERQEAANWNEV